MVDRIAVPVIKFGVNNGWIRDLSNIIMAEFRQEMKCGQKR